MLKEEKMEKRSLRISAQREEMEKRIIELKRKHKEELDVAEKKYARLETDFYESEQELRKKIENLNDQHYNEKLNLDRECRFYADQNRSLTKDYENAKSIIQMQLKMMELQMTKFDEQKKMMREHSEYLATHRKNMALELQNRSLIEQVNRYQVDREQRRGEE